MGSKSKVFQAKAWSERRKGEYDTRACEARAWDLFLTSRHASLRFRSCSVNYKKKKKTIVLHAIMKAWDLHLTGFRCCESEKLTSNKIQATRAIHTYAAVIVVIKHLPHQSYSSRTPLRTHLFHKCAPSFLCNHPFAITPDFQNIKCLLQLSALTVNWRTNFILKENRFGTLKSW